MQHREKQPSFPLHKQKWLLSLSYDAKKKKKSFQWIKILWEKLKKKIPAQKQKQQKLLTDSVTEYQSLGEKDHRIFT